MLCVEFLMLFVHQVFKPLDRKLLTMLAMFRVLLEIAKYLAQYDFVHWCEFAELFRLPCYTVWMIHKSRKDYMVHCPILFPYDYIH